MLLRLLLRENHRCAAVDTLSRVAVVITAAVALSARRSFAAAMPRPRDKDALIEGCMHAPPVHPTLQSASRDHLLWCLCVSHASLSHGVLQSANWAHKASRRLSNACKDTTTPPVGIKPLRST
jgi:hypothetical protein